jgi:hypothetical protein
LSRRRGAKKRARAVRQFTQQASLSPAAQPQEAAAAGAEPGEAPAPKRSLRERSGRGEDRRANKTALYAMLGAGGLAVFGLILVLINSSGSGTQAARPRPEPRDPLASISIAWSHPRVQAVAKWASAIGDGLDLELGRFSDFPALGKQLGVATDGSDPAAAQRAVLAALKESSQTLLFREFVPDDGRLLERAMHAAAEGQVELSLKPRPGKGYNPEITARATVFFKAADPDVRVTGWHIDYLPPALRPKEPRHVPHADIAKPQVVERVLGGEKLLVEESELAPLGHLADTPPALRAEIDDLIAKMCDLAAPGTQFNRSSRRLREIGRAAVPRVLNKMYETPMRTREDVLVLARVEGCMRDITGMAFGFNPADLAETGVGGTEEERLSALKQWYAWWRRNHDVDFTRAIDKSDGTDLFETEAEKEARKKAQEQAAPPAQTDARRK